MKNYLKRLLALVLVLVITASNMPVPAKAEEQKDVPEESREVVLVLDGSGSMSGTPMSMMKKASIKFCESMMDAEGSNKVAVVVFGYGCTRSMDFTSDIDILKNFINSTFIYGGTNIHAGLDKAKKLLDSSKTMGKKNIVLLTDGGPADGPVSDSGRYDAVGPDYSYKYGNYLYEYFTDNLKNLYNVYTMGFFHSMPESELTYARMLLNDIQNKGYYEVTDPDKLVFTFGDVASDIVETDDEKDCPIIIVPGVMGSQLYDSDMELVWVDELRIARPDYRLNEKMAMNVPMEVKNYRETSEGGREPVNQAVLAEKEREYGAQEIYKQLMDGIIEEFTDASGKCTRSIYFFSYDFRQSNDDTSLKLSEYINDILHENPEYGKVDIIAHSMGGLVVSDYVSDWGSSNIRKVITCGTPYEGAPKLVNSVLTNNVLDNGFDVVLRYAGGLDTPTKAGFPALAELAPTERYFNVNRSDFRQYSGKIKNGVFSSSKVYSQLTLPQYNDVNDIIFGIANASAARAFHNNLHCASGYNVLASLSNSYFIVGVNQKTISGIKFNDGVTLDDIDVEDVFYEVVGDGTVPYDSSTMVSQISSLPASRYITVETTHTGTVGGANEPNSADALKNICDILADRTNAPTTSQLNKQGYIVVKIACPVDVTVKHDGEILCSDKDNLETHASYGVLDIFGKKADVKTMCLDIDEYDIKLNGTDNGTMDFTVRYYNEDNGLETEYEFTDVAVTADTRMSTTTNKDGIVLNVDEDGDGRDDYQLEPGCCEGNGHIEKNSDRKVTYVSNDYDIQYEVLNEYGDNYNAGVVITNKSNEKIHNWKLAYDSVDTVENIWNGCFELEEDYSVVRNAGYNQDIAPGESVSFGFIAKKSGEIRLPEKFRIITEKGSACNVDYDAEFKITSDWGSGYNAEIAITNTSDHAINDWTLIFDFDEEIGNMWNGGIVQHEGNNYVVQNATYNHNIMPGESITIGFSVPDRKTTSEPSNYHISTVN